MAAKRIVRPAAYSWPPRPVFTVYGRGGLEVLSVHADSSFDAADRLMLHWSRHSRTVVLGISSRGSSSTWTEPRLQHVENLLRYDLGHDGYAVTIERVTERRWQPCAREFKWKLRIRG